ncbi:Ribonuclease H [Abeliophyllum distichum]|uniref:Ribonuclease H n=1 Tax=Abeliophyllum distichum TaxID=126358 RepID=A0ABD1V4U2_9LAMI
MRAFLVCEINTIIKRPYVGGHTMNMQRNYANTAREELDQARTNDGSTVNILFGCTFDQMDVDHELTAILEPLFSFTGDSLVPQGRIILTVNFGEPPCHLKKFIEFLVVDTRYAYHRVLDRPTLKDLQGAYSRSDDDTNGTNGYQSQKHRGDMVLDEGLDPKIIGSNSLASPTGELKAFPVNPSDPSQM